MLLSPLISSLSQPADINFTRRQFAPQLNSLLQKQSNRALCAKNYTNTFFENHLKLSASKDTKGSGHVCSLWMWKSTEDKVFVHHYLPKMKFKCRYTQPRSLQMENSKVCPACTLLKLWSLFKTGMASKGKITGKEWEKNWAVPWNHRLFYGF